MGIKMKYRLFYEQDFTGCYVASHIMEAGEEKIIFASETERTGKISRFEPGRMEEEVIAAGPGGCMAIVPVPDRDGDFMAILKFFPVFQSENAEIVWFSRCSGGYRKKVVGLLPFVHRIDILKAQDGYYLLACSLCKSKGFTDDWSTSGSVYAGKINFEKQYLEDFRPVADGIFKNHGFTHIMGKERDTCLIAGECGVFCLTPPVKEGGKFSRETLFNFPASDVALADIDGDGAPEYGVISPFHGEKFEIYKRINGRMEKIYELPGKHEFGHALYGGEFEGKQIFLVGFRAAGKELFLISRNKNGEFIADEVAAGMGPANVTVIHGKEKDYICAADRESDKCSVYISENE